MNQVTTVKVKDAVSKREKGKKNIFTPERLIKTCVPLAIVLLWWVLSNLVGEKYFASPGEIVTTVGVLFRDGYVGVSLATHIVASLLRTITGYLLAVALAIPIGLWMGMNKYVSAVLTPVFAIIRPIPAIAFLPLFIMWFRIGEPSRILLIFMSAFLYIVLNTYGGVKTVPNGLIQAAENLGANRFQLFSKVIFPATLPPI